VAARLHQGESLQHAVTIPAATSQRRPTPELTAVASALAVGHSSVLAAWQMRTAHQQVHQAQLPARHLGLRERESCFLSRI